MITSKCAEYVSRWLAAANTNKRHKQAVQQGPVACAPHQHERQLGFVQDADRLQHVAHKRLGRGAPGDMVVSCDELCG